MEAVGGVTEPIEDRKHQSLLIEAAMKTAIRFIIVALILLQYQVGIPEESTAVINCGDTITENTKLVEDLVCPTGIDFALIIGASNLTLDLGGYTISGSTPGIGVYVDTYEGITIRNGLIEGFTTGISINNTHNTILEDLIIRNLDVYDENIFIFGMAIVGSQEIVVRNSLFEFPYVFHKEAVEIFESDVSVVNIDVHGGGVGVNFSYLDACDPVSKPSNGSVSSSSFSDIRGGGIWVACSSDARITGNHFSTTNTGLGVGVQGDAPFPGAVTGLLIEGNSIHHYYTGIEFRGTISSTVTSNTISDNSIGIMMRLSLGCLIPGSGEECFQSTANTIAGNQTWGNGTDLSHDEEITGNVWENNGCETREGAEIPECIPPAAALTINYANGKPGSFFTLEGANFPASSTATITINGYTPGTVPTDASGDFIFLLNTEEADEGAYVVTAEVNPSASVRFVLDSRKFMRPQEGSGTIFNLPAGLVPHLGYLPLILK